MDLLALLARNQDNYGCTPITLIPHEVDKLVTALLNNGGLQTDLNCLGVVYVPTKPDILSDLAQMAQQHPGHAEIVAVCGLCPKHDCANCANRP